jgi:5-methylcytosine-specific restriction protein A
MPIKPKTFRTQHDSGSSRERAGRFSHLYKTYRWKKLRAHEIKVEPLCADCLSRGIITPATVRDHIEPHRGDLQKFWHGKRQSLCKQCHDSHKQAEEKSGKRVREIGFDGFPVN